VTERPPAPPADRPVLSPWRPQGFAFRALFKVRRDLEHERPVVVQSALEATTVTQLAQDVIAGLEELSNDLADKAIPGITVNLDDEDDE
jgi:hypothetical protein